MDRRTRRLFVVVVGLVVVAGLAWSFLGDGTAGPPDAPTVDGVVIKVDSAGLAAVSAFTLRTADGRSLTFDLSQLRNGVAFPPGHLAEHLATSQQVRVWYRTAPSGDLQALWLEDVSGG